MEYMFLITVDETAMPERATAEPESGSDPMAAWIAYNQRLIDGGHWISGASLQPSDSTTTIRRQGDAGSVVTDGPFTESKEQVAGYYTVRAADLDEAMALAEEIPLPYGVVEVRPLLFRADA